MSKGCRFTIRFNAISSNTRNYKAWLGRGWGRDVTTLAARLIRHEFFPDAQELNLIHYLQENRMGQLVSINNLTTFYRDKLEKFKLSIKINEGLYDPFVRSFNAEDAISLIQTRYDIPHEKVATTYYQQQKNILRHFKIEYQISDSYSSTHTVHNLIFNLESSRTHTGARLQDLAIIVSK